VIEYLREKYYIQENNFNSVPAETNTFLPTNKNLTNQQGTKKTQKNSVLAQHRIILLPSLFRFLERKKKKNKKSSSQPLPHAATPDGNSTASELEGEDDDATEPNEVGSPWTGRIGSS
jgi:hypothetical protein